MIDKTGWCYDDFNDDVEEALELIDTHIVEEKFSKEQAIILLPILEYMVDELMARYNIQ